MSAWKSNRNKLILILDTNDVVVIVDAKHLCVSSRGIKHDISSTIAAFYEGAFNISKKILELQNFINNYQYGSN